MDHTQLKSGTDIRGVAVDGVEGQPVTLTDAAVEAILASFLMWCKRHLGLSAHGLRVAVGRDSRVSGPRIVQAIQRVLLRYGAVGLDCGLASTPSMFLATLDLDCPCAVLKARSPSRGSGAVYDGSFTGALTPGDGVAAAALKARGVAVFTEEEGEAPALTQEELESGYRRSQSGLMLPLTQEELEEFYITVSKAVPSDFSVYLYNIPQCSGNDIQVETCRRIAEACPNVVGIKYSFADVHRALEYLQIRDGNFSVLVGFDRLLLPALAMGCGGTVSGAATVFPEPLVEGLKAYKEGNIEAARVWMKEADGMIRALKAGTRMSIFKAAQQMRGLTGGHVHKPLMDLTEKEREELAEVLAPYLERYPLHRPE